MARYPDAQWRPLGPQAEPRLHRKHIIVLHTMVGSLDGTDSYFRQNGYSGVESHFGVGNEGTVYQWQNTTHQADAQGEGNDNCISIETADTGPGFRGWSGSDVPAWTEAQLDAIADLVDWLCRTHNIPRRLIPDSGDRRKGIGYHRQGVDPWREAGAETWSSAYGKVCPGDRRIHQIKTEIIPRVRGGDWFDMATKKDLREVLREELSGDQYETPWKSPDNPTWNHKNMAESTWKNAYLANKLGFGNDNVKVPEAMSAYVEETGNEYFTGPNALTNVWDDTTVTRRLVQKLAQQSGVDVNEDEIAAAVLAGMREHLSPAQIAEQVREVLGDEFSQQVVDELSSRLSQ